MPVAPAGIHSDYLTIASNTKKQQDLEAQLNEQLYKNVYLLSLCYPTTDELKSVLKKDMFLKLNKEAFHQVAYFLLEVFDRYVVKQKITSWPVLEVRMESQFRKEVLKYLNEIAKEHEDFGIPTVMMSHLLSPCGHRFLRLMVKFSQLVMYRHLEHNLKENERLRLPIKPNKKNPALTEAYIKDIQSASASIASDTQKRMDSFNEHFVLCSEEADRMAKQYQDNEETMAKLKLELEQAKSSLECNPSLEDLKKDIKSACDKLSHVESLNGKLKEMKSFLSALSGGNRSRLEYKAGELRVPEEVDHIIDEKNRKLDLCELFKALSIYARNHVFDVSDFSVADAEGKIQILESSNEKLSSMNEQLDLIVKQYNELLREYQN